MNLIAALKSLDVYLFLLINNSRHDVFLDWLFLFFSYYPLAIWVFLGLIITFIEERSDKLLIISRLLIALVLAGAVASVFLKPVFRRPRPDLSHGTKVTIVSEKPAAIPFNNDFAFPSGHAAVAFAGAFILSREETKKKHKKHSKKYKQRVPWIFYTIAILTAFSRIYLGKHYPLDVIGGAIVGVSVGWLTLKLIKVN